MSFTPFRGTPSVYRYGITLKQLDILAPFAEPVTVRLSHRTAIGRVGQIDDCRASVSGIVCRE